MSTSLFTDGTAVNDATSSSRDQISIEDWSQTGRASHVDFGDKETIPIVQGRFLGRGSVGDVHETIIQGHKFAHKKVLFRRPIGDIERREIKILKRLSHVHIVQLVGTYTQRRYLGMILYPVATCDLHTFFEDVEAWSGAVAGVENGSLEERRKVLDSDVEARLDALQYDFPHGDRGSWAAVVYYKMGCLVSAITYLHNQKIRHKDLKPSNILLSPGRLWLSDFGSATDFTQLSQSATNNERGTPRYFAPEVADWKPNGRPADMFSLGCVLLEILSLHRRGSLQYLRAHREADPSFHANIDHLTTWLKTDSDKFSRREHYLECEINLMLSADPKRRPTATELLHNIVAHDSYQTKASMQSVFGDCCKRVIVPQTDFEHMARDVAKSAEDLTRSAKDLTRSAKRLKETKKKHEKVLATLHYSYERALQRKDLEINDVECIRDNHIVQLQASRETCRKLERQHEDDRVELRAQALQAARREELDRQERLDEEIKLRSKFEGVLQENRETYQRLATQHAQEVAELRAQIAALSKQEEHEEGPSNEEDAELFETMLPPRHDELSADPKDSTFGSGD